MLLHFRFGSDDLHRILNIIGESLHHADNRGQPLPAMQNLCIALDTLKGANFQRIEGASVNSKEVPDKSG